MKKFIVAILAFFYLAMATGASVHIHYCMGKLAGLAIWQNEKSDNTCGKCGMPKSGGLNDCCKDEYKFIKIDKDQQRTGFSTEIGQLAVLVPDHLPARTSLLLFANTRVATVSHAPPGLYQSPLYDLHCVYRI